MDDRTSSTFIPTLTVMVDYGGAPFLWLIDDPEQAGVGLSVANGHYRDESVPLSEGLWRRFADWAIEFDRTRFYASDFNADGWDWPAFHARGRELSRSLKEEVGGAYRVIYEKPAEDPNMRIDERVEILADGTCIPWPPHTDGFPEPRRFCERIMSGGQTGADRGALDFSIRHGYAHGGWAPCGRRAEDGTIPPKYQLLELPDGGYPRRTRRNVEDSDGTLIINLGEVAGGTLATRIFAEQTDKPCLVVQLDTTTVKEAASAVLAWLHQHAIKTLNVAGPRESKQPGIHQRTVELLEAVDTLLHAA